MPRDTAEIEAAVRAGTLVETSSFDAKRELPATAKKNVDLAVDVAAMSTAGGVLLYGIAEDEHGRPTVPQPIELPGAVDRVGQIVSTSISEVPYVDVREYPLADDPQRGYLVIAVPQSARAPHQVTVGGDLRFYGRGPTGNRRLTESDVAHLYERRQSWTVDRERLLDECVEDAPLPPNKTFGFVHAFARPVVLDDGLFERAAEALGGESGLQQRIGAATRASKLMDTFDPSLGARAIDWQRQGADTWRISRWRPPDYSNPIFTEDPASLAEVVLESNGRGRMFCGRATDVLQGGEVVVMEVVIAGNVAAFLGVMGALYAAGGYLGQVDVGVMLTNLRGAGSLRRGRGFQGPRYGDMSFRRTGRFAAGELADSEQRTRDLLGRFFAASTYQPDYDPFTDIR